MLDHATPIPSSLRQPDEAELQRVLLASIHGAGRRSAHPGDRAAAAQVASEVLRALRQANYLILQDRRDEA
jgi:hypothetical protein